MQQNCLTARCVRQHTMDSMLKSSKPRLILTWNRNGFTHVWPVLRKLHEFLGYKFTNHISNNSDFDISDIIEIQNHIDLMVLSTCKLYLYQEIDRTSQHFSVFWLVLKQVWRTIRDSSNGGHCLLTVRGWNRSQMCEIHLTKLSCVAQQVGSSGWD